MIPVKTPDHSDLLEEHFDNIVDFLQRNVDAYPAPQKIRNNDWASFPELMESKQLPIHTMFGKCFHSAKFVLFFGGGKKYFDLMLLRPFTFCSEVEEKTTHWYVRRKKDGKIFDPTANQFIYDVDINDIYPQAKKGDFGNPYFGNKRNDRFEEVVPNSTVFKLGELYKEEFNTEGGISWWRDNKDSNLSINTLETFME